MGGVHGKKSKNEYCADDTCQTLKVKTKARGLQSKSRKPTKNDHIKKNKSTKREMYSSDSFDETCCGLDYEDLSEEGECFDYDCKYRRPKRSKVTSCGGGPYCYPYESPPSRHRPCGAPCDFYECPPPCEAERLFYKRGCFGPLPNWRRHCGNPYGWGPYKMDDFAPRSCRRPPPCTPIYHSDPRYCSPYGSRMPFCANIPCGMKFPPDPYYFRQFRIPVPSPWPPRTAPPPPFPPPPCFDDDNDDSSDSDCCDRSEPLCSKCGGRKRRKRRYRSRDYRWYPPFPDPRYFSTPSCFPPPAPCLTPPPPPPWTSCCDSDNYILSSMYDTSI